MKNSIMILMTFNMLLFGSLNAVAQEKGNLVNSFPRELMGVYQGISKEYFMQNPKGGVLVIQGKKIPVSSINYIFTLKDKGILSLKMTLVKSNQVVDYIGTYKVDSNRKDVVKLQCSCSLPNSKSSNPKYTLIINKTNNSAVCKGQYQPEVLLRKTL